MKTLFYVWVIYLLCFILLDRAQLHPRLFTEFITLSLPLGVDAWFFKVIIVLYLLLFLLFRLSLSDGSRVAAMLFAATVYYLLFRQLSFGPWWYNTIFHFPLGMFFAWKVEAINRRWYLLLISAFFTGLASFFTSIACIPYLCSALCTAFVLRYLNLYWVPGLSFIGVNSLFYYFLECPSYDYIAHPFQPHFLLYLVVAIAATSLLTYLYLVLKQKIRFSHRLLNFTPRNKE